MTPRSLALATPFVLLGLASLLSPGNTAPTTHHAAMNQATEAVEPDMHEFMEYYFQPTYRRLKETMAAAPADNAGWKAIKADSIILAESGNLLIGRGPEDQMQTWNEISIEVRDAGAEFYGAAKAKDFDAARKHYETMIQRCNTCHQKFADGEHQLTP